jgi:hypothetical protein
VASASSLVTGAPEASKISACSPKSAPVTGTVSQVTTKPPALNAAME